MTTDRMMRKRRTWQRRAVFEAVAGATCHETAEEIHRRLCRGRRPIGLATVYRALDAFVRDGEVEPVFFGDGRVRYGLRSNHHDHLVCLRCGRWESLRRCIVRPPRRTLSGFHVAGHRLELYGYCKACRPAPAPGAPS